MIHPDFLLDRLTSRQISEWEAYDRIDPIGEWVKDFRFAVLDSLIINIVQKLFPKKGATAKDINPIEFMPDWLGERGEVKEAQTVGEMKDILFGIAKAQNKKVIVVRKTPPVKKTNRKEKKN